MLDILGSLISGPIIGLVGSGISAFVNYKNRQLDLQENREKRDHELQLYDKQVAFKGVEMEHELDVQSIKAAVDLRTASYTHDASYGQPTGWAVNALRLFRPGLTALLLGLVCVFWFTIGDDISFEGMTMQQKIVTSIVEMAGMAMAWWFGSREQAKSRAK